LIECITNIKKHLSYNNDYVKKNNVFYFFGGVVPLIVVLCSTLRPTSLLGACVLEWAKCPTAKLSDIMKSPGSH